MVAGDDQIALAQRLDRYRAAIGQDQRAIGETDDIQVIDRRLEGQGWVKIAALNVAIELRRRNDRDFLQRFDLVNASRAAADGRRNTSPLLIWTITAG
ncbi:hypothetical protein [Paracoccus sp. S1E-3]|uniref:hypothetical protein n=1 Tax=Paracoccus sp. S1E-3 TaxID=2756130 RepID=UPI002107D382|nr:hypothetical protein [Paracoccus sp. S1E-3]